MLELKNICKMYQNEIILDHLSLTLESTGCVGIIGESGCGKTSLLSIIGLIDHDYEGQIYFNGETIEDRNTFRKDHISFVMQNKDDISSLNVKENIILPSLIKSGGYDKVKYQSIVRRLGINELLSHYPSEISGGQRQRMSIAKALLKDSKILLCDEPTGALFYKQAVDVMTLLKDVSKERLVIIVSHDQDLINQYCDTIYRIENKGVVLLKNETHQEEVKEVDREDKKIILWTYIMKQLFVQKYKLLFLFLFQCLCLSSLFLMVSGATGILEKLDEIRYHSPLSYTMTYQNRDSSYIDLAQFQDKRIINQSYSYYYENCSLENNGLKVNANIHALPTSREHISLESGRMPERSNEILVSSSFYKSLEQKSSLIIIHQERYFEVFIVGVLKEKLIESNEVFLNNHLDVWSDLINVYEVVLELQKDNLEDYYDQSEGIVFSDVLEMVRSYDIVVELAVVIGCIFVMMSLIITVGLESIVMSIILQERIHDHAYLYTLGLSLRDMKRQYMIENIIFGFLISIGTIIICLFIYFMAPNIIGILTKLPIQLALPHLFISQYDLFIILSLLCPLYTTLVSLCKGKELETLIDYKVLREE